jgi:hypothetical protein
MAARSASGITGLILPGAADRGAAESYEVAYTFGQIQDEVYE